MKEMIENLINGNLTDAKRQAEHYNIHRIRAYCVSIGWTVDKATKAALYLKLGGQGRFQDYCDAK